MGTYLPLAADDVVAYADLLLGEVVLYLGYRGTAVFLLTRQLPSGMLGGLLVAGADDGGDVVARSGIVGKAGKGPCRAVGLGHSVAVHQVAGLRDVAVVLAGNVAYTTALQLLADMRLGSLGRTHLAWTTRRALGLELHLEGHSSRVVMEGGIIGGARQTGGILAQGVGGKAGEGLVVGVDLKEGGLVLGE